MKIVSSQLYQVVTTRSPHQLAGVDTIFAPALLCVWWLVVTTSGRPGQRQHQERHHLSARRIGLISDWILWFSQQQQMVFFLVVVLF